MPGSAPRLSPDGLHPLLAAQLADVKLDARELFNDKRIWPMLEQVSATYVHAEHALHPQLLASVVAEQCDEGGATGATEDAPANTSSGSPVRRVSSEQPPASGVNGRSGGGDGALPVLDANEACANVGGEMTMVRRFYAKFNERLSDTMRRFEGMHARHDLDGLRREVSSLECSAAYVGASALRNASVALRETASRALDGDADAASAVDSVLRAVKTEAERASQAINAELSGAAAEGVAKPSEGEGEGEGEGERRQVVNWAQTQRDFGVGGAILSRLARAFTKFSAGASTAIKESAANGDLRTLSRESHSLKGSAGYLGATQLAAYAATLHKATLPALAAAGLEAGPKKPPMSIAALPDEASDEGGQSSTPSPTEDCALGQVGPALSSELRAMAAAVLEELALVRAEVARFLESEGSEASP